MLSDILIIAGAYLWGGIPSAYLAARYSRGIDIRDYGSGNVGASNIMAHLGKRKGLLLGAFDSVVKGTLPVLLVRLLEDSLGVQVGVGLAVIAGHNWSPYIRFTGGRGVATAIGVIVGFFMWQVVLILALVLGLTQALGLMGKRVGPDGKAYLRLFGLMGRLIFHDLGLWTLVAIVLLPVLALVFDEPPEIVYMTLGIGGLLILKRLTANWERPSPDYPLAAVLGLRVLWDRDVPRRMTWVGRSPSSNQGGSSADVGGELLP